MDRRVHRLVGVLGGLALAGIAPASTATGIGPSSNPDSGATGRIVFSRPVAGGGSGQYTVNPDGTDERLVDIPELNEDFGRAVWSPDGDRLLFSNIFRFDATGEVSGFRPATAAPDGSGFEVLELADLPADMYCTAWSPGGTGVACGVGGATPGLWTFPLADDDQGGTQLTINPQGGQDNPIGFSTDGSRLAFVRHDPAGNVVAFVAAADGSDPQSVTEAGALLGHELSSAAWAPDGQHLISATPTGELVVVAVDGTDSQPIDLDLASDHFAFNPSYSSDGSRIVFAAQVGGQQSDIYTADPDGSNVVQVTHTDDVAERFPDWGPAAVSGVATAPESSVADEAPATTSGEAGAAYESDGFVVPFDVTLPNWVDPAASAEESNFVTWEAPAGDRAIRFLAPVSVYPPGSAAPTPVPDDYVDYLLAQTEYGALFSDRAETSIDGIGATVVTATTASGIDGGVGCQADDLAAADCYGLQPGYVIRAAVMTVGDQVLVIWERDGAGATPDYAAFESMLASIDFLSDDG